MGLITMSRQWPQRTIPFVISRRVPRTAQSAIAKAVETWNRNTVVRLRPLTELYQDRRWMRKHPNPATPHIKFVLSIHGIRCNSHVGMRGGAQQIRCLQNWSVQTLIHELGHAIGLLHEQQRPDRDQHVLVNPFLIRGYRDVDFAKKRPPWSVPHGTYDCQSVMHYRSVRGFTARRGGRCSSLGRTTAGASAGDYATINQYYARKPVY